jgi:hypothetical protein
MGVMEVWYESYDEVWLSEWGRTGRWNFHVVWSWSKAPHTGGMERME